MFDVYMHLSSTAIGINAFLFSVYILTDYVCLYASMQGKDNFSYMLLRFFSKIMTVEDSDMCSNILPRKRICC